METETEDDPLVTKPMIRRIVSAADAGPPPCSVGGSVFDLFGLSQPRRPMRKFPPPRVTRIIERDGDVVRCTRVQVMETDEWQEKERNRRERQIEQQAAAGERRRGGYG